VRHPLFSLPGMINVWPVAESRPHTYLLIAFSWSSSDVTITATSSLDYIMREFLKGADVIDGMWPTRERGLLL
jgi:hypothetical protein